MRPLPVKKMANLYSMKTHQPALAIARGLLFAPVVTAVVIFARGCYRPKNRRGRFGTIIVLGTAQYDGVPSRQFAGRLQWAAELWHDFETQRIITVGGNLPGDRYTEAEVGRTYLLQAKVDPDCIVAVPKGNDTAGSYQALTPYLLGKALIVTDPNHCLRAELLARFEGIDGQSSPTPYCPTHFPGKNWTWTFLHELGGMVVVVVRALLGKRASDLCEDGLRYLQGWLRPSRVARHQVLRGGRR